MQHKIEYSEDMPSFSACWERVESKTDLKNQTQLAKLVGKSQSYISKLKNEDVFLPEWAYLISKKYDVSMEWLLDGTYYKPDDEKNDLDHFLDELKLWILSFKGNKDKERWFFAKFNKSFPEFEDFVFKLLNNRLNTDHLNTD